MKFRDLINENLPQIDNSGVGYVIPMTMSLIAQSHVWHLLCPSGQKHTALGELYEELQSEIDELAEKFIAQGGTLQTVNEAIEASYDEYVVINRLDSYRNIISASIGSVQNDPAMASIKDGLVDLQEVIDAKLYKFKLQ